MEDHPLSVAVGVVEHDSELLLIRRDADTYDGRWALPGGKIEHGEHPLQAAVREIEEETSLSVQPHSYAGVLSELTASGEHFLIHCCRLTHDAGTISSGQEGEVQWHRLDRLDDLAMVASDRKILEALIDTEHTHATCRIENEQADHELTSFELQS